MAKLTDRLIDTLEPPPRGNKRIPDSEVRGFNAQITAAGDRGFVLRYRIHGRERLYTIGSRCAWSTTAARNRARELRRFVDQGHDPLADREAARTAPTVRDLAARYEAEHLPGKSPRGAHEDRSMIRDHILPALGRMRVADVTQADIRKLHRAITSAGKSVRANRVIACARAMFNLAMTEWAMRSDNPCRGVKPNPEDGRERFLSPAEIARLSEALDRHPERNTVALIRFLMVTGCRFGEAANATWAQFDMAGRTWTRPSRHLKQRRRHTMPLSGPAMSLLSALERDSRSALVFPSPDTGRPLVTVKTAWKRICRDAGLAGVRVHDLRHSFASVLAGGGTSLQLIGDLLGHSQIATTQRYSHLTDAARRAATERAGAVITGGESPKLYRCANGVSLPLRRG